MSLIPGLDAGRGARAAVALAAATFLMLPALGGCGGGGGDGGGDATVDSLAAAIAGGAPSQAQAQATTPGGLEPTEDAVHYESDLGRFKAIFPPGCPRLRVRATPSERVPETNSLVWVFCDRAPQEGYMVSVYYEVEHEGPLVPDDALAIVRQMLARSNLEVLRQSPITRNGVEGIMVLGKETGSERSMWIEGFLSHGRVVVASAWWPQPAIFSDLPTLEFFKSLEILP